MNKYGFLIDNTYNYFSILQIEIGVEESLTGGVMDILIYMLILSPFFMVTAAIIKFLLRNIEL